MRDVSGRKDLRLCKTLIVPSDKTSKFCSTSVSGYEQLLNDNINKEYEECNDKTLNYISLEQGFPN